MQSARPAEDVVPRAVFWDRRVGITLLLGFASGLPLALTSSTLTFWLTSVGVSNTKVGVFALVGLPYTFKFLWAPFFDRFPPPGPLARLGRRRGWLLATQVPLAGAILATGSTDPLRAPGTLAVFALCVAAFSASQDVVVDAYRIESLDAAQQGYGAASTQWGYRIGMLVSGAGALYLSEATSWRLIYALMATMLAVGMVTALRMPEPPEPARVPFTTMRAFVDATVVGPFSDFVRGRPFVVLLVFLVIFRLGDAFAGHMLNPFLVETGFRPTEVANVTKLVGIPATMLGAGVGGYVASRFRVPASLPFAALIMLLSNVGFSFVAEAGHSVPALLAATVVENVTSGIGSSITVVYLSSLCSREYTASQYALLTAAISASRNVLSAPSGWVADSMGAFNTWLAEAVGLVVTNGWTTYFVLTALAGLPGFALSIWLARHPGAVAREA